MKKFISCLMLVFLSLGVVLISGCDEQKASFVVSAYVNGARFGDVYGGNDTYEEGTEVTLTAVPRQSISAEFVAWIHDLRVVSNKEVYTFTVNKNTAGDYIALFENGQSDLEYIAPLGLTLEYGTFDSDLVIEVLDYSLSIGYYENELYNIFEADAENNISVTLENMYDNEELPYAFDKTRDIYVKVQINYARNDFNYSATAIKKINHVELGQMPEIEITDEFSSAVLNGTDTRLQYSEKPKLTVSVSKLAKLLIFEEE